jgi:hypothetical protein
MGKLFIVYDERAMLEGTDEAAVLCTAQSLKEARRDVQTMFPRGVIYSYDRDGDTLVNEQFEAFPAQAGKD